MTPSWGILCWNEYVKSSSIIEFFKRDLSFSVGLDSASVFSFQRFLLFFFFFFSFTRFRETKFTVHNYSSTVHVLFMGPTATLFRKKIKNRSHGTIYTYKNYFTTVFSVFSFSKNKFNSNWPSKSLNIGKCEVSYPKEFGLCLVTSGQWPGHVEI